MSFDLFLVLFGVALYLYWVRSSVRRRSTRRQILIMDLVLSILNCWAFLAWVPWPWPFDWLLLPSWCVCIQWLTSKVTKWQPYPRWDGLLFVATVCNVVIFVLVL